MECLRKIKFITLLALSSFISSSAVGESWRSLVRWDFEYTHISKNCVTGRTFFGNSKVNMKGCSDAELCFLALDGALTEPDKWGYENATLLDPAEAAREKKYASEVKSRGYSIAKCDNEVQKFVDQLGLSAKTQQVIRADNRKEITNKIKTEFTKLDLRSRRNIQEALSKDDFYTSTIDGLYGRGTEAALRAYNKQYLNNADLTVKGNVDALYADLLKPMPESVVARTSAVEQILSEVLVDRPNTETVETPEEIASAEPQVDATSETMLAAFESQQYIEANAMAQELAADGDATAQYYLGRMFAEGLGTLQISKSAHMWFNIASLNGSAEAVTARNSVAESMSQTAIEEAQEMALLCIQSKYADCGLTVKPTAPAKAIQTVYPITDGSIVGNDFKAQTALRRKQLQYALKKLGVYSSNVDGLWGSNTSNAFTNYIKINSEEATNAEALFVSILSKVDVPTRFATPAKPKPNAKPKTAPKSYSAPSGWTTFDAQSAFTWEQADTICEPIAKNAKSGANIDFNNNIRCTGGYGTYNCSSEPYGAAAGFLQGFAQGMAKKNAYKNTYTSCMAQYGWKKD